MLDTIARRIVPASWRSILGCWALNQASRHELLLQPYLYLVHRYRMENLRLLPNKEASYQYKGYFIVSPRDGIGSFFEIFQGEVYDRVLKPEEGDIILDIGAYVGAFSIKASLEVGSSGMVIAIEPDPNNLKYLNRNIKHTPNIAVVERVISDRKEIRKFYTSQATASHSLVYTQKAYQTLETITLDEVVEKLKLPKVNYIKVDAEGSELEVLMGAENTLGNKGIKLSISSYHTSPRGESEAPRIIKFLEERGFKVQMDSGLRRYIYATKV